MPHFLGEAVSNLINNDTPHWARLNHLLLKLQLTKKSLRHNVVSKVWMDWSEAIRTHLH